MIIGKASVLLVNTNETRPPVAPIAIDYIGGELERLGYDVGFADLNGASDARSEIAGALARSSPRLVGVTLRNSDDCFWPSGASFVPRLAEIVGTIKALTDAPIVIGGSGYSVFPGAILKECGCKLGIAGDGERAIVALVAALERGKGLDEVPGLVQLVGGSGTRTCRRNRAHRGAARLQLDTSRAIVDNRRYFREGGQLGIETKRGCDRACTYCADPLIKGKRARVREPREVADEVENLVKRGIDVLHLCDSEFNVPYEHAIAVCWELVERGLGQRIGWYTYASVVPFSDELAGAMREAGCAGVNFGTDTANAQMLARYGRRHRKEDIAAAIEACKKHGLRVMTDLLVGGPGETEATLRETIEFIKEAGPDCAGAALGVRVYPGTRFAQQLLAEGPLASNANLRWPGGGLQEACGGHAEELETCLLRPVFYISRELGENPAQLVRDVIAGDERFFEPVEEQGVENYNYKDNLPLIEAIRSGARGAYWDILRKMRRHET